MTSRRIFLFKIVTVIVSMTLSIFLVEVAFKRYYQRQENKKKSICKEFNVDAFAASRGYSLTNAFYKPLEEVRHCGAEFDYTYHIDENGFRYNKGSLERKLLLAIGDSLTFGFGVKDEENFPALLNAYNAGMWGNPFDIQSRSFKRNIELLKPRTIVWGIYPAHLITMMPKEWSDSCPGSAKYLSDDTLISNTVKYYLDKFFIPQLYKSGIGRYILKKKNIKKLEVNYNEVIVEKDCYQTKEVLLYDLNLKNNHYTGDDEINKSFLSDRDAVYESMRAYFQEAKNLSEIYNAEVYFIILPSRMRLRLKDGTYTVHYKDSQIDSDLPAKTLTKIIIDSGFNENNIIDLGPYFLKEKNWRKYYFRIDAHWNADGHKFVANIIRSVLGEERLDRK